MDALEILEKTLNMKTIVVYDEIRTFLTRSGKKRVINQNETVLALEKQQKLIETFQKWLWKDEKRKELLETIFENKYGCVRRRIFDGSFLKFPGMTDKIELYPYQKNAVARILFSPNTLLAHDVGSGKTYVMIAAGMELKRMGLSRKNLYVVPNNIVMQWKGFFENMYPDSKVFCVEAKNFTPEKRQKTLETIRDTDWDAVIMAYSCFDRIPLSKAFLLEELQDAKDQIKVIEENNKKLEVAFHKTVKKVSEDIEGMKFNTAIAAMMGLVNDIFDAGSLTKEQLVMLVKALCPFAPHLCEEMWEQLGGEGLCSLSAWPEYDEAKTVDATVEIAVQVNGKVRATIELPLNCPKDEAIAAAKAAVAQYVDGMTVIKEIAVPNKIVNIVVKP